MTKHILMAAITCFSLNAFASDYETTTVDLGSCTVANSDVVAKFKGETVTFEGELYSKTMIVEYVSASGEEVPNPADKKLDQTSIPASDDVKIKEKKNVFDVTYKSSSNDKAQITLNKDTGAATLTRYLAFKGSLFSKKEVHQDFSLSLTSCSLDTSAIATAVGLEE